MTSPDHTDQKPVLTSSAHSSDKKLNKLLNVVLNEVSLYAEDQIKHIRQNAKIGQALSAEKDINKLLDMIITEAKELINADAGTLYILSNDAKRLQFKILHNDTLGEKIGRTGGNEITLPDVPIYFENGEPNNSNVSSYVALTGKTVNIPDVYESGDFDFTGPRQYDAATGYRSVSMLVIPLRNHENNIIGVVQLLNAKDSETGNVIPFPNDYVDLIASLASQAAVALTNAQLIEDLKNLFYSFIRSIATVIDEKSPYTAGHIKRVVDLTMLIAEGINETDEGVFKNVYFNKDELEEILIASWMHDVGKIITPEHVINKGTKLETITDRIEHVKSRFQLISKLTENEYLQKKLLIFENSLNNEKKLIQLERDMEEKLKILNDDLQFIINCNNPFGFMSDDDISHLKEIAVKSYSFNDEEHPYLTDDELKNLSIVKGTLTDNERQIIENHALMTIKITEKLPFPKKLSNVPEYAGGHHEKLDGTGYPKKKSGDALPLQTRIMAIADIFEALTARDRPYKKPMPLSQALVILEKMKSDNHIDPDIYDFFVEKKLYRKYAEKELAPEQLN